MRAASLGIFLVLFTVVNCEHFKKYDAAAVKRFDAELRRLGVVLTSLSTPENHTSSPDPVVSSAAGDFEGYWTESVFGRPIAAFEGIPYAQPPVGPLRFKLAQPAPRLSNFKAKEPGSKCLQRDLFFEVPNVEGSEDCLYLNVYVPETVKRGNGERLPVVFFVHGGAYVCGQSDIYKSNTLLDKDVVLVTFNYRLGPLGFLTTGDDVIPANLGLKDQVAALRWVHDNIAAFGGDPNLVTVFGHSAGGASVEFLMTSPLTKGLLHRVIAMSGSAFGPWAVTDMAEMVKSREKAAEHLGCPAEPSRDFLSCLLTKSAEEITGVDYHFRDVGRSAIMPFKPVVEGDVPGAHITHIPGSVSPDGVVNDVPYMTGATPEEGTLISAGMRDSDLSAFEQNLSGYGANSLLLFKPEHRKHFETLRKAYLSPEPLTSVNKIEIGVAMADIYFIWPAVKSAKHRNNTAKSPVYMYHFSSKGSRSFLQFIGVDVKDTNYGVSHGDDLFYLFPLPLGSAQSPKDVLMSIILTDIYSSFARNGVPSSKFLKTEWQPLAKQGADLKYLHFKSPLDITMQNESDFLPERMTLLSKLLGSSYEHDEL